MSTEQELEYLIGALKVLRTELSTTHQPTEVMQRIQNIKDCIVRLIEGGLL